MKKGKWPGKTLWILLLASPALLVLCAVLSRASTPQSTASLQAMAASNGYVVLAWNNLGMHCIDRDYSNMSILPPYNVLRAQVIKIGDPPQFVTGGITISYSFPGNTKSVTKTNFWTYAMKLFHLSAPLPPNIGLTGKGLTGTFDLVQDKVLGEYFEAAGIPLTEYSDTDKKLKHPHPYQLATIIVRDAKGKILAKTHAVAPISSELMCVMCHADTADATTRYPITPTGKVETNILALHDYLNRANPMAQLNGKALLASQPVQCADCHADNAVGAAGIAGIESLSFAMHNHHNNDCLAYPDTCVSDITPDTTSGCYNCHPGPKTQCLRDVMSEQYAFNCTTCHGNMAMPASPGAFHESTYATMGVAPSITSGRRPWLDEPKCSDAACHGPGYAMDQPLFQNSRGHGGIYCEGCHDSTHAIAKSREPNDAVKFMQLQGQTGSLRKCTVCHKTQPTSGFQHSWAH
jgi:hypothetical protein